MASNSSPLTQALSLAQNLLQTLAHKAEFLHIFELSFGDRLSLEKAEALRQAWIAGDFTQLPTIHIESSSVLQGANGAYATQTNYIYLSQEFLTLNNNNPQAITNVLIEEVGHYIDSYVNNLDVPGDEGAIFSSLVSGETLNDRQFQQLKLEDDSAIIVLNGQSIQVEQSAYSGGNVGDVIDGLDQLLDLLQDAIEDQVFGTELPLLGNTLKNSYDSAVQFLKGFETQVLSKLHEKLDAAQNKTPELVRQALVEALGPTGLSLLQDLNQDGIVDAQDVRILEDTDDVKFTVKLKNDTTSSTFNTSLDTDIGVPSLGLTVNGSAQVGIGYDFNLTFGVNKANGFYFDTATDSLKVELNTSLPNLSATGKLNPV